MAVASELRWAPIDELWLDPRNPRLGRRANPHQLSQSALLEEMAGWALEELATSYLDSGGFWSHEALLVVREEVEGDVRNVVVEGNRRLAALRKLRAAKRGEERSRRWVEIASSAQVPEALFDRVPYLIAESRTDVEAFIGFRHVTGIKEWAPEEKAAFISALISQGLSYEQVRRKIGSKAPTVRQHYVAHRLLLQIEDDVEAFSPEFAANRFSVLYLSLRSEGVKSFLAIDIQSDPQDLVRPVPETHLRSLGEFALWLFGDAKTQPVLRDSRDVDSFGRVLQSEDALAYLRRGGDPSLDIAMQLAGGDEEEVARLVNTASDLVERVLSRAHHHVDSDLVLRAFSRFRRDADQLTSVLGRGALPGTEA